MSDTPDGNIYSFENFQLDSSRKLLLRLPGREAVPLTTKAFQLLLLLVENGGRLVTKDDLMATVWRDSFVEEANLTQTISVLRKILGETPNQHRFIVTETGRGYRFVAPINGPRSADEGAQVLPTAASSNNTSEVRKPVSRRAWASIFGLLLAISLIVGFNFFWNRPAEQNAQPATTREVRAIAVLPFGKIEPSQDDQLLGIGMADAIITKLSHVKGIVVRQTRSVIRYAGATPEATRVGREINVDAVLEGTIQKADGRMRVSVRLYRVSDGALLWAENFDELDSSIFDLQDSISEKVATSLALELNPTERDRLKRRYTKNIEAYQLYSKGRFFWNNRSSEDLQRSIAFYQQAIAKDANYALAYSGMAESYVLLHLFSEFQEKEAFELARQSAEKAEHG